MIGTVKTFQKKIKSSIWARKEKGMYMASVAPYGYTKSKEDKHKLVVNKQEARIVKEYIKSIVKENQ